AVEGGRTGGAVHVRGAEPGLGGGEGGGGPAGGGGVVAEVHPLAGGAARAVLFGGERGLLGGGEAVQQLLRLGQFGLALLLLRAEFGAGGGQVLELAGGLRPLLRQLALLGLDLLQRLDLLAAELVQGGGLVQVVVRVGGQEQLERGVEAAAAVLG